MALSSRQASLLRADPICVADVGARGGRQRLCEGIRDDCLFIGFEPEGTEAERLQRIAAANERYIARALHSAQGTVVFHHCVVPARSSLYRPDRAVIAEIYGTDEHYRIVRSEPMDVTTLDALVRAGEIPWPEVIKLDTQGSELDILKGGREVLTRSVVAIALEVEFVPLYEGQPLFVDVDTFLRSSGYQLDRLSVTGLQSRHAIRTTRRPRLQEQSRSRARLDRARDPSERRMDRPEPARVRGRPLPETASRHLESAAHSADRDVAILKAVVIAAELGAYDYALEMCERAESSGVVAPDERADLERYVTARSHDVRPLLRAGWRQVTRLARRLARPGRR